MLELLKPLFIPELLALFRFALTSSCFVYRSTFCEETDRVTMNGLSLSPLVSNRFMEAFVQIALDRAPYIYTDVL